MLNHPSPDRAPQRSRNVARSLHEQAVAFSLHTLRWYRTLDPEERASGRYGPLLRSAAAVGADPSLLPHGPAMGSYVRLTLQMAREARYWLRLLAEAEEGARGDLNRLVEEAEALVATLVATEEPPASHPSA